MKQLKNTLVVMLISLTAVLANGATKDIVETAESADNFKILVAAVGEADLVKVLQSKGPFTVLAPTDEAFGKLPKGTLESLLKPENKGKLISILKYHVIAGSVKARQVAGLEKAQTILGKSLPIKIKDGRLTIGNVNIIGTDIIASNGVIHVIDQVLLPPEPLSQTAEITQLIESAVESGAPLYNNGQRDACVAIYKITCQSLARLGKKSLNLKVIADLEAALEKSGNSHSSSSKAWTLRGALDRTYKSLENEKPVQKQMSKSVETSSSDESETFKVLLEAGLPAGFPKPGPLNKVILKKYPEYRAARVGGAGMQNIAFMRLFAHIKQNGISMTAPVEMAIDENSAKRQSMAFLYGSTSIGETGKQSSGVEVLDLPSREYVSIGLSGSESESAIKGAIAKLENWLVENNTYTTDGEPRLLGYNSPMVPKDKRFWEVQIPVKLK